MEIYLLSALNEALLKAVNTTGWIYKGLSCKTLTVKKRICGIGWTLMGQYKQGYSTKERITYRFILTKQWTSEIKKFLQQVMNQVDGLHYIHITDKEGVSFLKIVSNSAPDLGSRLHLLSNCISVAEQASKLGVGNVDSLTVMYSNYQVILIIFSPLVLTFIASANSNTGFIQNLKIQLAPLLHDLKDIALDRQL